MTALPDISAHLHTERGFCYPDWDGIWDVIEDQVPEADWHAAWANAARCWVGKLRDHLGGGYGVFETPNFIVLSDAPDRVVKDTCRSCEDALRRILAALGGVARDDGYGKHVVLMFSKDSDYYGYISHYYAEGDHPASGGVCLRSAGYVHFAFLSVDHNSYRPVLVHELTHVCLKHFPIPAWLDEALAMRMERALCGTTGFILDRETHGKHLDFWDETTIQWFWSGECWNMPGEGFTLAYQLAEILWRKIETEIGAPPEAILDFVSAADQSDAGEASFRAVFDISLGDLAGDFLGEGDWRPDPARWPTKDASG